LSFASALGGLGFIFLWEQMQPVPNPLDKEVIYFLLFLFFQIIKVTTAIITATIIKSI